MLADAGATHQHDKDGVQHAMGNATARIRCARGRRDKLTMMRVRCLAHGILQCYGSIGPCAWTTWQGTFDTNCVSH